MVHGSKEEVPMDKKITLYGCKISGKELADAIYDAEKAVLADRRFQCSVVLNKKTENLYVYDPPRGSGVSPEIWSGDDVILYTADNPDYSPAFDDYLNNGSADELVRKMLTPKEYEELVEEFEACEDRDEESIGWFAFNESKYEDSYRRRADEWVVETYYDDLLKEWFDLNEAVEKVIEESEFL